MRHLQATTKGDLARHKTTVHEELKYSCGQCDHKAISKVSLCQHKREVHEGVKYYYGKWDHMRTSKDSLVQHKKKHMKDFCILVNDVTIKQLHSVIFLGKKISS